MSTDTATRDIVDGRSMFRSLQRHKTDDLILIDELLSDHCGADRLALLDLCSGIGRTIPMALEHGWDIVCVDIDESALKAASQISPMRISCYIVDLSRDTVDDFPQVQGVICTHNSANEVGAIRPLFALASQALAVGGWFYLDLLTGSDYLRPYELEFVQRIDSPDEGTWTLETVVRPRSGKRHELILLATHFNSLGTRTSQVQHTLLRTVFERESVTRLADEFGFLIDQTPTPARFIFRRIIAGRARE